MVCRSGRGTWISRGLTYSVRCRDTLISFRGNLNQDTHIRYVESAHKLRPLLLTLRGHIYQNNTAPLSGCLSWENRCVSRGENDEIVIKFYSNMSKT